jgi:hypothetical protein
MIALINYLSDQDLVDLRDNDTLLDATRKAAREELIKRQSKKTETDDI